MTAAQKSGIVVGEFREAAVNSVSDRQSQNNESTETQDRRDIVVKLGKFAAYVAPFTIMASTRLSASFSGGKDSARPAH